MTETEFCQIAHITVRNSNKGKQSNKLMDFMRENKLMSKWSLPQIAVWNYTMWRKEQPHPWEGKEALLLPAQGKKHPSILEYDL